MRTKHYDAVIVGGGLTGWLVARALSDRSLSVALFESTSHMGGLARQGLEIVPDTREARLALEFVEVLTGLTVAGETMEYPPVTLEKGILGPFVGFGECPPPEVDEISWYAQFSRIALLQPPYAWIEALQKNFHGDVFPKSQITRFNVENGLVKSVQVNGDRDVEAKNFIFSGNPQDLPHLVPQGLLAPKFIQKLSRAKLWNALSLQMVHGKPVTAEKGLHVLMGGGEHAIACVGLFQDSSSRWIAFLPADDSDEETTASALREMKRQIKRVYPEALDVVTWERIAVSPRSHGQISMKEDGEGSIQGLSGLWLTSGLLHPARNMIGSICRTQQVLGQIQTSAPELAL